MHIWVGEILTVAAKKAQTGQMKWEILNETVIAQFFQMREYGPLGHRVSFGRHIGVDPCDNLFGRGRAGADGFQNVSLTLQAM